MDEGTKSVLQKIPLLRTNAGPRNADGWKRRLKEELLAVIKVLGCLKIRYDHGPMHFFLNQSFGFLGGAFPCGTVRLE